MSSGPIEWPPRFENIVNLSGKVDFAQRRASPIYKVPAGKSLIVTDLRVTTKVSVIQRFQGKDTEKLSAVLLTNSYRQSQFFELSAHEVGLTFQPRSLVVIEQAQSPNWARYHVRGYLVDMK